MSRMTGVFTVGGSDEVEAPELLDPRAQMALKAALHRMAFAIFTANREIIGRDLTDLDHDSVLRFAVVVAEQRASYVREALRMARSGHVPKPEDIERLRELRTAYEEMAAAFDAMRRLIERGYTKVGDEGGQATKRKGGRPARG